MKKFLIPLVVALALAAAFAVPALAANGGATPGNTPGSRAGCCPPAVTVCPILTQTATATIVADTDLPPCCQTGVVPATASAPATVCPVVNDPANMPCATVTDGTVTLPCAPAGGGCPMFR
jgi:hypothetical protein